MMSKFQDAMRRVITGDNAGGRLSLLLTAVPRPKCNSDLGGLFEIWEDAAFGPLMPSAHEDSRDQAPGARTTKGQFPGALVSNPSSAGGHTQTPA